MMILWRTCTKGSGYDSYFQCLFTVVLLVLDIMSIIFAFEEQAQTRKAGQSVGRLVMISFCIGWLGLILLLMDCCQYLHNLYKWCRFSTEEREQMRSQRPPSDQASQSQIYEGSRAPPSSLISLAPSRPGIDTRHRRAYLPK